jgi:hypothetical protein
MGLADFLGIAEFLKLIIPSEIILTHCGILASKTRA